MITRCYFKKPLTVLIIIIDTIPPKLLITDVKHLPVKWEKILSYFYSIFPSRIIGRCNGKGWIVVGMAAEIGNTGLENVQVTNSIKSSIKSWNKVVKTFQRKQTTLQRSKRKPKLRKMEKRGGYYPIFNCKYISNYEQLQLLTKRYIVYSSIDVLISYSCRLNNF